MATDKTALIIPVEGQARELDAKLLLACAAAERGFCAILGSRNPIHLEIARLPRGVYLAKSLRSSKKRMFRILRDLGHEVVAWDEEAVVRFPRDDYYRRRLSPEALSLVSHLFAWGEDDAQVFRGYPQHSGIPIHVTGNPRIDLLRPELRGYYDGEVDDIRRAYGDFVLINTNFGYVNAFAPSMNLLQPSEAPGGELVLGHNTKGMEPLFARALAEHKRALFEHFCTLVPALAEALPDHTVVVRPHPSEDHAPWQQVAAGRPNVAVVHEKSVVPWLIAARVMIHNGCTTAVESAALGTPAVAYRPVTSDGCDFELPNSLSHQVDDLVSLLACTRALAAGERPAEDAGIRRALLERHIGSLAGPLAADRMVDALSDAGYAVRGTRRASWLRRLRARRALWIRGKRDRARAPLRDGASSPAYHDHRFPGTSVDDLRARIQRFGSRLGRFERLSVARIAEHIYRIEA